MWRAVARVLRADERGAQSLEFVALLPMVLLTLLLMLQMALLGYTLVVAESATREAALVAARDPKAGPAVAATARHVAAGLQVSVTDVACTGGRVTVVLEAAMPNVLFDSALTVRRSVTMPTQEGDCG
jgi:Flp pilus assembly protein TadG